LSVAGRCFARPRVLRDCNAIVQRSRRISRKVTAGFAARTCDETAGLIALLLQPRREVAGGPVPAPPEG
jgi:hypothetical protein